MIIGFIGYMGSGKTVAADYLVEKKGYTKINFKDALVAEMKKNFPDLMGEIIEMMNTLHWDGQDLWTVEKLFRDKPPIFRAFMQNYGTEVRRGDNDHYWTRLWAEVAATVIDIEAGDVVTDDVRFKNEAQTIKNAGGILVRIVREDVQRAGNHASEVEMEGYPADYTITAGKGEFEKLYSEIDSIIK